MPDPIEILLIEDDPGDVRLTLEALKGGTVPNHINVARDGDSALDFLFRKKGFENAPRPDLILLDLNLPGVSGREVLQEIRADPQLTRIPVVVLTTSRAEEDILKSYELHANCYISKPMNLDKFLSVVRSIETFWLSVVHLPARIEDN